MKRLCLMALLFCGLICNAQTLKFLGIPLGISSTAFKQKLLSKGFTYSSEESNNGIYIDNYIFYGNFAGDYASVCLRVTPKTRLVYCVSVRFLNYKYSPYVAGVMTEELQNWKFNTIKNIIIEKYPNLSYYDFSSDDYPLSTIWEDDKYEIALVISWYANYWRNMDLNYTDKTTQQKREKEKYNDF